ncbi:MAG TPA: dihydropteroate synthase [Tepidisphaeraceae bacterium]|jgi:dihydropteroate synthase|nr:dihydropteroate synthase [Tepidisphaeraceae bacterium]
MSPADFDQWLLQDFRPPLVMGVLNVTPDSFSDGGKYATTDAAIARAEEIADAGAHIIDIGGESTRPGAEPVSPDEQIRRVVPVLQAVAHRLPVLFSIDTTSSEVAQAALDAGAAIINDISAGRDDPHILTLAGRKRCPIILMHMLGRPKTMQQAPHYEEVTPEVAGFLNERIVTAGIHGVDLDRILLDPGIGFGKMRMHNLQLLRNLRELTVLGRPLVIGTSRKRFIGEITGETDPDNRLFGTAATVAWSLANGASIVRVHDVEPMMKAVRIIQAIIES